MKGLNFSELLTGVQSETLPRVKRLCNALPAAGVDGDEGGAVRLLACLAVPRQGAEGGSVALQVRQIPPEAVLSPN